MCLDNTSRNTNVESKLLKKLEEASQDRELDVKSGGGDVIDYGTGIKTMRLIRDRIYDIEELKKEEEGSEEEEDNKDKNEAKAMFDNENPSEGSEMGEDSKNIFKNRKNFVKFIKEGRFSHSKSVTNLRNTAIITLAFLAILSITTYVIVTSQVDGVKNKYLILQKANLRYRTTQTILFRLNDLLLLNIGFFKNMPSDFEETTRVKLRIEIQQLQELQKYIQQNNDDISDEQNRLFYNNVIPMTFWEESSEVVRNFDINEGEIAVFIKLFAP